MIAAAAEDHVIGRGPQIPWQAKGEQLIFSALTFNQWLIVGRKTFESMGNLVNRKFVVVSRTGFQCGDDNVIVFADMDAALNWLRERTQHVIVSGGGEIYKALMPLASTIHLSRINMHVEGDVYFPEIPADFGLVFEQGFHSNVDYTYQIWQRGAAQPQPQPHAQPWAGSEAC